MKERIIFNFYHFQQYTNYMQLFNYINSHKEYYNAEVKFGTVADYFDVRIIIHMHYLILHSSIIYVPM